MCGKISTPLLMLTVFFGILLTSCIRNNSEKLSQENLINEFVGNDIKNDDFHKFITDLPIKLDSSECIIFPIHELTGTKRASKTSYKSRYNYENHLNNIIFQNVHTDKTHFLTTNEIKIVSYEQLYNAEREAEKIILYQVIDSFPKDKDALIFTSLYLGTNDGKLFKKISKPNHQLNGWKYISETKKIYFKTIKDSDKNNELNQLDKHSIYSVSIDNFTVKELLNDNLKTINN